MADIQDPSSQTSSRKRGEGDVVRAEGVESAKPAIIRVRGGPGGGDHEMQIDVPTLVALIQQGVLGAAAEVNGDKLTGGEWKKLGGLEVFEMFRPSGGKAGGEAGAQPELPEGAQGFDAYERNLMKYFGSFDVNRLRLDGWAAIISATVAAVLSAIAHHSLLTLLVAAIAWGGGYLFMDRVFFPAWIRRLRRMGFKRLPWSSRNFLIVAVAVPCYFLVATFLPLLPGERLLRLVDSIVCIMFSGATAGVWTFRVSTLRAQRVFELSKEVSPKSL
jgi:hypothetical protein